MQGVWEHSGLLGILVKIFFLKEVVVQLNLKDRWKAYSGGE